jgi:hypothetical protein
MIALIATVAMGIVIVAGLTSVVFSPYASGQIKAFGDAFTGSLAAAKAH